MQVELVRVTTSDGVRLDGMLQHPSTAETHTRDVDGVLCVHGTGGNFYSSSLFESIGKRFLQSGVAVLRVNTRGHDGISTAVTTEGGRRQGAAYERVDDCRFDLAAWLELLGQMGLQRIGVIGHSLGAVKSIYALAQGRPSCRTRLIAISPPRLSHRWFCESTEAARFLQTYKTAKNLAQAGQGDGPIEVEFPLPMIITSASYLEKYGPDERYDLLKHLPNTNCPTLVTFGGRELEDHVAFRGSPQAIGTLGEELALSVAVIPQADHFYTGLHGELFETIEAWLANCSSADSSRAPNTQSGSAPPSH